MNQRNIPLLDKNNNSTGFSLNEFDLSLSSWASCFPDDTGDKEDRRFIPERLLENVKNVAEQLNIIREAISEKQGQPVTIVINSGYRPALYNEELRKRFPQTVAKDSRHIEAKAADIKVKVNGQDLSPKEVGKIITQLMDEKKILPGFVKIYNDDTRHFVHYDISGKKIVQTLDGAEGEAEIAAKKAAEAIKQTAGVTPKESEQSLSPAEEIQKKRLTEQCILLLQINKLKEYSQTILPNRALGIRDQFVIIEPDSKDGGIANILSKFTNANDLDWLNNLTSAQKALLVPRLKIFKRKYNDKGEISGEQQFKFSQYTENSTIEDMTLSHQGRGGGTGIVNFIIKQQGKDPGSVQSGTEAILTIFAQSLDDLVTPEIIKKDPSRRPNSNFEDSETPAILDLIRYDNPMVKGEHKDYNVDYFTIRVEIGWDLPDTVDAELFDDIRVIQAIRRSVTSYILTLKQHELTFKENGSVELRIDYLARQDQYQGSVFAKGKGQIERNRKELEDYKKGLNEAEEKRKKNNTIESEEAKQKREKEEEQRINEINASLERSRSSLVAEFLSSLLGNDQIYYQDIPSDLFTWDDSTLKELLISSKGNFLQAEPVQSRIKSQQSRAIPETTAVFVPALETFADAPGSIVFDSNYTNISNAGGAALAELDKAVRENSNSNAEDKQKTVDNILKLTGESTKTPGKDGFDRIHYMYSGDLINAALRFSNVDVQPYKTTKDPLYLLGPTIYHDPILNEDLAINLADIPISVKQFVNWFTNTFVTAQLTDISLDQFLNSMMTGLIMPALICTTLNNADTSEARIRNSKYEGSLIQPGQIERITREPLSEFGGQRIPASRIDSDGIFSNTHLKDAKELVTYYFIYGVMPSIQQVSDEESFSQERDRKFGIPWLRWGVDRGMIKTMSFAKSDTPYLLEAQMTSEIANKKSNSGGSISTMPRLYNVEIKTLGVPLFLNGNMVYIDPSAMVQNPLAVKIPQHIGLSGYYTIVSVEHVITANHSFDSTLQTVRCGTGRGLKVDTQEE